MKAEVIREIAEKEAAAASPNNRAAARLYAGTLPRQIAEALRILERAGFAVVKTEDLEAALKPFAKAATLAAWPTHEHDINVVDDSFGLIVLDLRRAAALLAAITQETKE